jgi:predicted  nucleic acid-binding Zn-ribbon protein
MPVMLERWNDDKMDALDAKVDDMDVRLARVEVKVDEGFAKVDKRFEQVDKRFEQVDKRFEQVDKRFEKIDAELLEQRREMKAGFEKLGEGLTHLLVAVIGAGATISAAILTASLM